MELTLLRVCIGCRGVYVLMLGIRGRRKVRPDQV